MSDALPTDIFRPKVAQSRRGGLLGVARAVCFNQFAQRFKGNAWRISASGDVLHYAKILASLKIKNVKSDKLNSLNKCCS